MTPTHDKVRLRIEIVPAWFFFFFFSLSQNIAMCVCRRVQPYAATYVCIIQYMLISTWSYRTNALVAKKQKKEKEELKNFTNRSPTLKLISKDGLKFPRFSMWQAIEITGMCSTSSWSKSQDCEQAKFVGGTLVFISRCKSRSGKEQQKWTTLFPAY